MKKKYVRLTWNGGRVLELTYNEYKMNKEYWDKQQCTREEYWSQQFLLHTTWLYVFGFAAHVIRLKAIQPIGKTDIYSVLATWLYFSNVMQL